MTKSRKLKKLGLSLGLDINNKLKFDSHITSICFKANQKLCVLSRLTKLLAFDKKLIIFKALFKSQFKYCSLNWIFYNWRVHNKIDKLHERTLRLVYDDHEIWISDFLAKDMIYLLCIIKILYKYKYCKNIASYR